MSTTSDWTQLNAAQEASVSPRKKEKDILQEWPDLGLDVCKDSQDCLHPLQCGKLLHKRKYFRCKSRSSKGFNIFSVSGVTGLETALTIIYLCIHLNHRITELLRLEKTFKVIWSNQEGTSWGVLDVLVLYRGIGMWPNSSKCQMLDTWGLQVSWCGVSNLEIHRDGSEPCFLRCEFEKQKEQPCVKNPSLRGDDKMRTWEAVWDGSSCHALLC